jgi:MurNAc alpha-1-phosphate uridylyltransferase
MILAAGLGKRMRPLTNTIPKPLVSVAGKSMLERTFEHIESAGIPKVVVNSHYLAPLINDFLKNNYPETLVSYEEVLLETGGGIKKALPLIGEEPFFTLNGDSIWTGANSLSAMKKMWMPEKMEALLLLIPRAKAYGYTGKGDFFMSEDGRLMRPKKDQEAPYVYIGVQLTHPVLFEGAPEGSFSLNILWNKALQQDRLYGYVHQGEWFHISTPEDLSAFEPIVSMMSLRE